MGGDTIQHSQARKLVVFVIAAVALFAGVRAATSSKRPAGDFLRYDRAATLIWRGEAESLYDTSGLASGRVWHDPVRYPEMLFRYSPALAIVLSPLGALPPDRAWVLWSALSAGLVLGGAALSAALGMGRWSLEPLATAPLATSARGRWLVAAVTLLPLLHLYSENVKLGQMNCFAFAFSVASLYALDRRRERLAGVLAAVAVLAKHIPIVLVIWFAWRRRWRAAITSLVAIGVLVYALPTVVLGPTQHHTLLREWIGQQDHLASESDPVDASDPTKLPAGVEGQSVKALLFRYLTPAAYEHLKSDAEDASPGARGIAVFDALDLPHGWVLAFWWAAIAALLFITARVTAPTIGEPESASARRFPLEAAAVLVTMLLISPESRNPHFQMLAPAYAALAAGLIATRFMDRFCTLLVVVGMVLVLLPTRGLVGRNAADYLLAYGSIGIGAMVIYGALIRTLRRERGVRKTSA